MTTVLAIDTTTRRVSVAIGNESGVLGSVALGGSATQGPPRHVEQLAPAIRYVTEQLGVQLDACDVVAVTIGPGMFTGLRVGVVTAKTIADMLGVPMVTATSLELIAAPVLQQLILAPTLLHVVAMIDARRNEVYCGRYCMTEDRKLHTLTAPNLVGLGVLGEWLGDPLGASADVLTVVCGDGVARIPQTMVVAPNVTISTAHDAYPNIGALVRISCERVAAGDVQKVDDVQPLYLRQSDAEINAAIVSGGIGIGVGVGSNVGISSAL